MVVFYRIKGFIAGHWMSTNAKPQLLSFMNCKRNSNSNTSAKDTFPSFSQNPQPHHSWSTNIPSESSKASPPQFVRIHSFMEYNKTGWKNQNRKKSEYKKGNMKNKHRLFQCFTPATNDSSVKRLRPANGPTEPLFTYIAAGEKEGVVFPKILPPDIDKEEGSGCQRTKSGNSRLSRILKAVFFGASLGAKRSGKSKLEQGRSRLGTSNNVSRSNSVKEYRKNKQSFSDDEKRINSSVSPSFRRSSSCTSACPSNSTSRTSSRRFLPETCKPSGPDSSGSKQRQDNAQAQGRRCHGETGSYLLLVSLLVLIFWGKIFAICCLSAWFYLIPRRTTYRSPEEGKGPPGICFEEYKKKVIKEGLLERNHTRRV